MKRLASSFVLFSFFVLSACTAQTTTQLESFRYILYDDVTYLENDPGFFQHLNETIYVEFLADRTVYHPTFSDAVVSIFSDDSMTALYSDGWTATCAAATTVEACVVSSPDAVHGAELATLITLRDGGVTTGHFEAPDISEPLDIFDKPITALGFVVVALSLFEVYLFLLVILPQGARNRIFPSGMLKAGRGMRAGMGRTYDSNTRYWQQASSVRATISDEFNEFYGKGPNQADSTPCPTLRSRFLSHLPILIVTTVLLGLAVAGLFLL